MYFCVVDDLPCKVTITFRPHRPNTIFREKILVRRPLGVKGTFRLWGLGLRDDLEFQLMRAPLNLNAQMTLKSIGPIPWCYESLFGIWTLNLFRVRFVFKGFRKGLGLCNLQLRSKDLEIPFRVPDFVCRSVADFCEDIPERRGCDFGTQLFEYS